MKRILKTVFTAVLLAVLTLSTCAITFTDVPEEHWAYKQINDFSAKGIVSGDGNGIFRPDDGVTREEFCKMLCETFRYTIVDVTKLTKATYSDVPSDRWSFKYVENCLDYLPGSENNGAKTFSPAAPALRDDLAAAVVKMMGYTSGVAENKEYVKTAFSDGGSVKDSLVPYVSIAVEKGIVNGYPDGSFKPENGITRAEAVVLLARAYEKYVSNPVSVSEAKKIINDLVSPTERDIKVAYSIDGYDVTYAEIDFMAFNYLSSIVPQYGVLLLESEELISEVGKMLNAACNLYGTTYKLAMENNIQITMSDIKTNIYTTLTALRLYYGDDLETMLAKEFDTSLNFMLVNCLMNVYSTKLTEQRYAYGTPQYEAILKKVTDIYESIDCIKAKHILIGFGDDADKSYNLAKEVLKMAKSGTDFDTLIAKYNEDPGMSTNPDGYIFNKGKMVEPFEKAAYALDDNEISDIVKSEFGYHIIKRVPLTSGDMTKDEQFAELASNEFSSYIASVALNMPYSVVKQAASEPAEGEGTQSEAKPAEEYQIDIAEYVKEHFKVK